MEYANRHAQVHILMDMHWIKCTFLGFRFRVWVNTALDQVYAFIGM
jgi:hypothetical protein